MRKSLLSLGTLFLITTAFTVTESNHSISRHSSSTGTLPLMDTIPSVKMDTVTDVIFTKAEVEPQFIGGETAWRKFLEKNLDAAVPVDANVPVGSYTIVTQFIVEKDGTTTDIKSLTKHGYGLEEECIRTIKLVPKWQPATQNGRVVRCYKKQPITFIISKG
jgi:hypothetical protein